MLAHYKLKNTLLHTARKANNGIADMAAASPATVQRETLFVLAEIEAQKLSSPP